MELSINIKKISAALSPYKGIIYFVVLLLGSHFLWKLVVDGDLHSQQISVLGIDVTSQFHYLAQLTAQIVYNLIKLFPNTEDFHIRDTYLYFTKGGIILNLIWGCTGIKQLYIFTVIILFFHGPWKKKLWYIPLGCILLLAYNIIRIALICIFTKGHPEKFDFLHEGLFRYIFYGLIFLLWVIWEEKFAKRKTS